VSLEDALLSLGCEPSTVVDKPREWHKRLGGASNCAGSANPDGKSEEPAKPRVEDHAHSTRAKRHGSVVVSDEVVTQTEVSCRTSLGNALYRLGLLEPLGVDSQRTRDLFRRYVGNRALREAPTHVPDRCRANLQYDLAAVLRPHHAINTTDTMLEDSDSAGCRPPQVQGGDQPVSDAAGKPTRKECRARQTAQWEGALAALLKARDATPGHGAVLAKLARAFTLLASHCRCADTFCGARGGGGGGGG